MPPQPGPCSPCRQGPATAPGPSRIVHLTWKDRHPPAHLFPCWWRETWGQPGWEVRLWTDADIADFVRSLPAALRNLFAGYPRNVMRADAFRYLLLKQVGGLYVDLDFVNLGGLDWLIDLPSFSCGDQGEDCLCNAFLWSPRAGDLFWDGIEEALLRHAQQKNPVVATGPHFLTAYAQNRSFCRIPRETIYPVAWDDSGAIARARRADLAALRRTFPRARAVHVWTGSWFEECGLPIPSQAAPAGAHQAQGVVT